MSKLTDRQIYASIAYLDRDLDSFDGVHQRPSDTSQDAQALALLFLILLAGSLAFIVLYLHIV